jgi:hypothetical protein
MKKYILFNYFKLECINGEVTVIWRMDVRFKNILIHCGL